MSIARGATGEREPSGPSVATSIPAARAEHPAPQDLPVQDRATSPARGAEQAGSATKHHCHACGQPLDDLPTGLLDRRRWDELAAQTLARARQQRHSVTLVMLDLDRFKEVNDGYGHPAGDAVLRGTADVLRAATGQDGFACRYGGAAGDEFLVLLGDSQLTEGLAVAERIRAGIAAMSVTAKVARDLSATITGQTASLGVAAYCPVDLAELDLSDLLLDADVALRAAKRHGRDRICLANVDLTGEQESRSRADQRLASWSRFRRLRSL